MNRRLILASSSPRRRELLREAGYRFVVEPPRSRERPPRPGEGAGPYVLELARAKVDEVARRLRAESLADGAIVLGADTVAELGGEIVGKPRDAAQAREFLERLAGSRHAVVTGLVLALADGTGSLEAVERTELEMAALTPDEIEAYVASGEPYGKAGAYAIQETGDRFVRVLSGSVTNVVGLPMERLAEMVGCLAPELAPRSGA